MVSGMVARTSEIYAWLHPISGAPVYVGKTSAGISTRMTAHRTTAKRKAKTRSHRWLRRQMRWGFKVEAVLLATCSVEASSRIEREWIAKLEADYPLLNERVGGHGNPGVGRVDWSPEVVSLLGVRNDAELADMLGCNRGTVGYRRRVLGIKPVKQPLPASTITLPPEVLAALGDKPDYVLAQSIGVSRFVIAKHRRAAGIPSYAEETGHSGRFGSGRVKERRVLPPEIKSRLGKEPDYLVGRDAGLDFKTIARCRRALDIPAVRAKKGTLQALGLS